MTSATAEVALGFGNALDGRNGWKDSARGVGSSVLRQL
jgi:hypothetical protein